MKQISAIREGIKAGKGIGEKSAIENSRLLKRLILRASQEGKALWLDFLLAEFAEPIEFESMSVAGLIMGGAGASTTHGGTTLSWVGPSFGSDGEPSVFLGFLNARNCLFQNFSIVARKPLGYAIESVTSRASLPSTDLKFSNIIIDGINGDLLNGISFKRLTETENDNANNDFGIFENVSIINFGHAGGVYKSNMSSAFHFDGAQSRAHRFFSCNMSAAIYVDSGELFGLVCGSFHWIGGAANRCSVAFVHTEATDPILIQGVNSEGCRGFFESVSTNRVVGVPTTIDSVRYAANEAQDGDVFVRVPNPGPLTVTNCTIDSKHGVAIVPVQFGPLRHGTIETTASCTIRHNSWRTSLFPSEVHQWPGERSQGKDYFEAAKLIWGNKVEYLDEHGDLHYANVRNEITS